MMLAYVFGGVLLVVFIVIIAGITLHDMRAISRDKRQQLHPHARKWRKRPMVSIIFDGEPTKECLDSIRKSSYRKTEIIRPGMPITGDLIMTMAADMKIERDAIRAAVQEFNDDPRKSRIELLPVLEPPQTLSQLFWTYGQLLSVPFVAAKSGMNITPTHSSWPTILHSSYPSLGSRTRLYLIAKWWLQVMLIVILAYVTYLALGLQQPQLLTTVLAAFIAWTIWSITGNRQLTFTQKIICILLSPVSYGYFLYLCISAPLRLRQYAALLPATIRL